MDKEGVRQKDDYNQKRSKLPHPRFLTRDFLVGLRANAEAEA